MTTFAQNRYTDSYDFFAMSFDPYAERRASRILETRISEGTGPFRTGAKGAAGMKVRRFFGK